MLSAKCQPYLSQPVLGVDLLAIYSLCCACEWGEIGIIWLGGLLNYRPDT